MNQANNHSEHGVAVMQLTANFFVQEGLLLRRERGEVDGERGSERGRVNGWVHVHYMHSGTAVPIVTWNQLAPVHTIQSVFTDLKLEIGMNLPSLPAQPQYTHPHKQYQSLNWLSTHSGQNLPILCSHNIATRGPR